jgi:hypothetical protein
MNNSLDRLLSGMVATLREEVIPHVDSEYARGQAYGLIYMLNSIQLRASWSPEFLGVQVAAQYALADAIKPLVAGLDAPPVPYRAMNSEVQALEVLRNENDGRVCALIEWHGRVSESMDPQRAAAIETHLREYMNHQLKWELETSAKPMFAEMSSGSE